MAYTYTFDVDGLQAFIGPGAYGTLTDRGQSIIAEQALTVAATTVNAKFDKADITPDWTNDVVITAGLCYAVYRLYARIENEIIAKDKMDKGNELLSSIIGNFAYNLPVDGGGAINPQDTMQSIFYVEQGTSTWNGFGDTYE